MKKQCTFSRRRSIKAAKTTTSGSDAEVSSGNGAIRDDNIQMECMNQGISVVNEDDVGYTSLKKEKDGYESLRKPETERRDDSEDLRPKKQCRIYEEIPDSKQVKQDDAGYILPQSHYIEVIGENDPNSPLPKNSTDETFPEAKEDESVYARSQNQLEGYVGMVDYTESNPGSTETSVIQAVSKAKHDKSEYSQPRSQYEGYVGIMDYSESTPSAIERSINQAVSKTRHEKSQYHRPEST